MNVGGRRDHDDVQVDHITQALDVSISVVCGNSVSIWIHWIKTLILDSQYPRP